MNAFPPLSKSDWIAKVEADLKGGSFEALRSTLPGGLKLEPLYTAEDATSLRAPGLPGLFPYLRGASPLAGWTIRQEYDDPRPSVCKELIRQDLERGVEALYLRLGPRSGCRVLTIESLDGLLESVDLEKTSVWLDAGSDALAVAAGLLTVAKRRGVSYRSLDGCLGFDPVGLLAKEGRLQGGLRARFSELCDLASWCSRNAQGLRTVEVSSEPYNGGGASTVQELAYSVAVGLEYLRRLVDGGLSVDSAARQIAFSYSVSGDFFTEIAKLRAARWLWAKVVVTAGAEPSAGAMHMHARTSRFTKTRRDPWVNVLRASAECAAAVLGGAQSVATSPFDCVIGPADQLAQRIARNTQVVLREEAHLGKVSDPVGGSWFVESLTNDLARAAWVELQSIEAGGGIVAALGSGKLIDAVSEVADAREKDLARRKTPIVGVSESPNLREATVERDPISEVELQNLFKESLDALELGVHRDRLLALVRLANDLERPLGALTEACIAAASAGTDMYSIATVLKHGQPDFHLEPILQWRQSEIWEELRTRSDSAPSRPLAFLANLGPIPSHKNRATWAQNLLAAAGIDAKGNAGFGDTSSLVSGWSESGASFAVIAGSDTDYETMLEPAIAGLKAAGCPLVLVAGRPGDREGRLREAGVSDFVYAGADVLSVMGRVLDSIGVQT